MEFVQIVEFSTTKIDQVEATLADYRAKREAAGATAPIQVLECKDREQPNPYLAMVRFSSADAAEENSNHPDTAAMAQQMMSLCDGPPKFRNLDLIAERT